MVNSNAIKSYIVKNGFTQEEVAKKLCISYQSLNLKINNKVEFSVYEAYKMCEILNIPCEEMKSIFFAK